MKTAGHGTSDFRNTRSAAIGDIKTNLSAPLDGNFVLGERKAPLILRNKVKKKKEN
jgi:hypothetical protein